MSSWDFIPKSGIYATGSLRFCLFCFYVHKIDFHSTRNIICTGPFSSLLKVYGYKMIKTFDINQISVTVTNKDYHAN